MLALPALLALLVAAGLGQADTTTACTQGPGSQTVTTSYPQDSHASFWTVPADVASICLEVVGAPGGDGTATYQGNLLGGAGGSAADVVAQLSVTPGQILALGAGAAAGDLVSYDAASHTWGSSVRSPYSFQGGNGDDGGRPGGYASVVALWAPNQFATPDQSSYYTSGHFDKLVVVAGGGGGSGASGVSSGPDGLPGPGATGGNGGTPDGQIGSGAGGGGGTGTAWGAGGAGFGNGGNGADGDLDETWDDWDSRSPEWLGRGGVGSSGVQYNGSACDSTRFGGWSGGGGGGGGYHGGGGGGRGTYDDSGTCVTSEVGGGGGGGASYVDPSFLRSGTAAAYSVADHTAEPSITIVWTPAGADTTAPAISGVPADATFDAASSAGAPVSYTEPTATDAVDGSVAVTCTPSSGSTFPLGSTTVACSATDTAGNSASASFTVTVADTTAPTLVLPAPVSETATSYSGATVTFSASAADLVDPIVTVTCAPSSGSVFPVGTTTVSCAAADTAGNTASGTFTVTVAMEATTAPTVPPTMPTVPPTAPTVPPTEPPPSQPASSGGLPAPTVELVAPSAGPVGGGTPVAITGTGFVVGHTQVDFGSVAASNVTVVSRTSITATVPQLPHAGTFDVIVTTPAGHSSISDADKFTGALPPTVNALSPSLGPIAGGTDVVITGSGFTPDAQVLFGTQPATAVTYRSPTEIDATAPASVPASVEVSITALGGTSLDFGRRAVFIYYTGSTFRPSPDGFSFQNYGAPPDSGMTGDDLSSVFGRSVCTTPSGACQLTAEAQTYLATHNALMLAGHCFGFATLSSLLWENGLASPYLDRGALGSAASTYGLSLGGNVPLQRQIALAWNMQTLPDVSAAFVRKSLADVVADLQAAFADPGHVPYVLVMGGQTGAHAVTPYAYAPGVDPGTYVVLVYDNNYPGDTKLLSIDTRSNSWSYPPYDWSGSSGSGDEAEVQLVPLDALVGQHPGDWTAIAARGGIGRAPSSATAVAPTAEIALTGNPRNHPHLVVTDVRGRRQGLINGRVVSEIPGGHVVRLIGGIPGVEAEPLEHVPAGTDVTLRIDGSKLKRESAGVAVSEIGPGFVVAAREIDVRLKTKSALSVRGDGSGLTYTAAADAGTTKPTFELARSTPEGDYRVEIEGGAVPAGAQVTAALDPATLAASVTTTGVPATDFRVAVTRRDASGGRAVATAPARAGGKPVELEARLPRLIAGVKLGARRVTRRGTRLSYIDTRPGRLTILTQRAVGRRWVRVRRAARTDRSRHVSVRVATRLPRGRYRIAIAAGERTTHWLSFTVR